MADFGGLLAKAKAPITPALKPVPELADPMDTEEDGLTVRVEPLAQDLIDAIRGGDASAVAEALIAVHGAIGSGASDDTALTDVGE